jgi:hypothetical protein
MKRNDAQMSSRLVGIALAQSVTELTDRNVMAYSSAVGATEDIYFDNTREGGVLPVPGFICAVESPLLFDRAYLKAINVPPDNLYGCMPFRTRRSMGLRG